MSIRPETPADAAAIRAVTLAAFDGHPHSDQTEHLIVERLRAAGALTLSLVADVGGAVVGHVAFSEVEIDVAKGRWFGLGPVSVLPGRQGQGIGSELINAGLDALRNIGAAGCVVAGDPAFYQRFGFRHDAALVLEDFAPQYFLALPLSSFPASGMVTYHPAFYAGRDE